MEVEVTVHQDSSSAPARTERLQVHGAISIGRSAQSTLCLEGESVSRTHVVIDVLTDGLRVEDHSSNGTVAGDVILRRQAAEVPFGTPLMIGQFTVLVIPAGRVPVLRAIAPTSAHPGPRARIVDAAALVAPPLPPNRPAPGRHDAGRPLQLEPNAAPTPPPAPRVSPPPLPRPTAPAPPASAAPVDAAVADPAPPGLYVGARVNNAGQAELPEEKPADPPDRSTSPQAAAASSASVDIELRRQIHTKLLENLDLAKIEATKLDDPSMRPRVLTALQRIVKQLDSRIPAGTDRDTLVGELADEALGLERRTG
jgi:pilus assembly protein CpaF